ncbi:hypothetical protein I4U23_005481 [Adineta vaga]|nr:hypothetical protein I4U23_005481 [Adineta vaga]
MVNTNFEKDVNYKPPTSYDYIEAEMAQFEEVGGICSNKDDVNEACCTVRSVVLGLIFVVGMSFFHQWGAVQIAGSYISSILVIVLVFPLGHLWTLIVPKSQPFTVKEHGFVLVMANTAWMYYSVFTYATLTTLKVLERDNLSFPYYFFFVLALQFLGFGLAGVLRRFLVWPADVIWPQNFPLIALLRSLHDRKINASEKIQNSSQTRSWRSRFSHNRLLYFFVIVGVVFIYEWFPLYIMPILRHFSWMCMISPGNNALAQLTAVRGLAVVGGGLTLDWYEVTQYLGSPLILPSWAIFNIAFGFILIVWIIIPIVYGANVRDVRSKPIGGVVSRNFTAVSLVTAFTSFACVSAVFMHAILFHGIDIWNQFRTKKLGNMGNDMHARLMSLYPPVPDWCYLELCAAALIVACVTCDHAGWLNWYWVLLSIFIGAVFVLPFGLVSSITGQLLHNLSVYYICILTIQSLPFGTSARKIYTFIALSYVVFVQTLALVQDMKLAHYLKIGPRPLFAAQCLGGFVCSTFSIGIRYMYVQKGKVGTNWSLFNNTQLGWNLLNDYVGFFSGKNSANQGLLWAFVAGAILPIPGWYLSRWPKLSWMKNLHWPLILITIGWMPAIVSAGALFTWLAIAFAVYFTYGKYTWSQRHIYLTSGALDLGVNLALIIINIGLNNQKTGFPHWWGNSADGTVDSCAKALN